MTLYEHVAERLEHLIEGGAFASGERLPSTRRLAREWDLSMATVMGALRLLESRGLIEARPRSGYYARETARPAPGLPSEVHVGRLFAYVLDDLANHDLLPLGGGMPDPALYPGGRLRRLIAAASRDLGANADRYAFPPGHEPLRAAVARRLVKAGCAVSPDEVVVTNGAQEALLLSLRAVCRAGDAVAVESPCYIGILQALELLGLKAVEIPVDARGLSLEALEEAVKRVGVRACVASCTVSNPTGRTMPESRKRALVDLLARSGLPLIEDDVNGPLAFGLDRPPAARAFDRHGLVLLCSSFSKTLAPGLRVGWVAPGRYLDEVKQWKVALNLASPVLPQAAVAEFLRSGGYDAHLRRLRSTLATRVAAMADAVRASFPAGTTVSRPQGGFLLWVEMPVDASALYRAALEEGVSVICGPLFSAEGRYERCIRLNASLWGPAAEQAIERLGRRASALLP